MSHLKALLFLLLAGTIFMPAQDLISSPKKTLPQLSFPSVYNNEMTSLNELIAGKKTVLHLFASW